jgi:hypothetical protein
MAKLISTIAMKRERSIVHHYSLPIYQKKAPNLPNKGDGLNPRP